MSSRARKIVYFGTSAFAVPPLLSLLGDGRFEVAAVVTQPDKPAGRKGEARPSPVAVAARQRGLRLLQPAKLKDEGVQRELSGLAPDLFVVAAYGKILPQAVLDIPGSGALNLHGSLLPKYRGASPIQEAIRAGEAKTGVTLMLMDREMDHGPVYAAAEAPIAADDTYGSLETKLAALAADLLVDSINRIAGGHLHPVEQRHDQATFTRILSRQDGFVSWEKESAAEIERKLRAFDPWPGTYAVWKRQDGQPLRLKIIKARPLEVAGRPAAPGTIFAAGKKLAVWTRSGALELIEVQIEGKKPASGQALMNGYQDLVGSVLESEDIG